MAAPSLVLASEYFLPSKSFETSLPKSAVTRSKMTSLSSICLSSVSRFPFADALQLESDIIDLFRYPLQISLPKTKQNVPKSQITEKENKVFVCLPVLGSRWFPLFLAELDL